MIPNRIGLVKDIRIFSCSGANEIGRSEWSFEEKGRVVGAGWGSDEMLYVICENGELSQYSPSGKRTNQFNLFSKYISATSTTKRVLVVAWWPSRDGFAILTDEVRIWASDIRKSNRYHFGTDVPPVRVEPVTGMLSGVNTKQHLPSAMAVVEGKHNKSRRMEVLLALWGTGYEGASVGTVYTEYDESFSSRRRKNRGSAKMLSEQSIMAMPLISENPSPITRLAIHCGGQIVAAICKNGSIVMFATDFSERLLDFSPMIPSETSSNTKTADNNIIATTSHHQHKKRTRRRKRSQQFVRTTKIENDLGPCSAYWSGLLLRCAPTLAVIWKRDSSSELLLLDIEGNYRWEKLPQDSVIISEVDGFRILSSTSMDMIHICDTSNAADALVNVSAQFGRRRRRRSTLSRRSTDSTDDSSVTTNEPSDFFLGKDNNKQQQQRRRNNSVVVSDDLLESLWSSSSSSATVRVCVCVLFLSRCWSACRFLSLSLSLSLSSHTHIYTYIQVPLDERIGIVERAVVESLRSAMTRFTRAEQGVYIEAAVCGKRWLEKHSRKHEIEKVEMFTPGDDDGRRRFLQSVGACLRQLRLLNALRDVKIGIPLTPPQLTYLGEHVLIARLARRRMYELAMRLTNHLQRHLDQDAIMLMWESDLLDAERSRERRRQQTKVEAMMTASSNSPPKKPSRHSSSSSLLLLPSTPSSPTLSSSKEEEEQEEARHRVLLSRLQNNFFKHSFCSYGSAAVVAGLKFQKSLSRRLLRHEKSQRVRVASLLLLDSPSYREKALREAASEPFGYQDTELLIATLLRIQSVVYPVKKISDDDFTDEARRIHAQQETEMHRMILAKTMPRSVLSCYVGLLRKMGLGNRLQRLLVKADKVIDAAHMYVERGCRFYLGGRDSQEEKERSVVDVIGDDTLLGQRVKYDSRDTFEVTRWRPSRFERQSTSLNSRFFF